MVLFIEYINVSIDIEFLSSAATLAFNSLLTFANTFILLARLTKFWSRVLLTVKLPPIFVVKNCHINGCTFELLPFNWVFTVLFYPFRIQMRCRQEINLSNV